MRSGAIPFQFDVSKVLAQFAAAPDAHASTYRLDLPFMSIQTQFTPLERRSATVLLTRLRDRRVLSAHECCDGCIDDALRSLQEIRTALVDMQVELASEKSGALYLLIELMLVAIRQFLTFEQTLNDSANSPRNSMGGRPPYERQQYFDALELLRGHLSRCLGQVTVVGSLAVPSDGFVENYRGPWPPEAYKALTEPLRCQPGGSTGRLIFKG
jgi:hypothetical protein